MKPTYFTCTLGQADALNLTNESFSNINQFIADLAEAIPLQPAVAFGKPCSEQNEPWASSIWTFRDVLEGSRTLAAILNTEYGPSLSASKTVALICPSTPEFLFTWLALMQLGHAVLLIAPQCQPAAIAHLCKACDATAIFHDGTYVAQTTEAVELASKGGAQLNSLALPFDDRHSLVQVLSQQVNDLPTTVNIDKTDVAYLHHTSGTSSGVPKPIPQTHRAGAGVLPAFPEGKHAATFTTTPLYHGGIADLFRAWASGALIWLFPGKGVPISAHNIVKCLDVGAQASEQHQLPPIKYFSSVPYVLQMLEADVRGLRFLQKMDIVGVGGAALPTEVGDRLVGNGVNLVSRFGSAECGFLMSSHRDYAEDKEWQYLRSNDGTELLGFEKHESGLHELVVLHGWPHMVCFPESCLPNSEVFLTTK